MRARIFVACALFVSIAVPAQAQTTREMIDQAVTSVNTLGTSVCGQASNKLLCEVDFQLLSSKVRSARTHLLKVGLAIVNGKEADEHSARKDLLEIMTMYPEAAQKLVAKHTKQTP